MKTLRLLTVACASIAIASSAFGDTIIYDTTPPGAGGYSVQVLSPMFDSFSTGINSGPISSVEFDLSGVSDSGTIAVELYSDNSGSPGSPIATLGVIDDTSLPTFISLVDLALTSNPVLAAGTRYWIGLVSTTTSADAGFTDVSGIGTAGEFYSLSGPLAGIFPDSAGGEFQAQVAIGATPSSSTPEPGTLFLFASGLTALLAFVKIRRMQ